MFKIVILGKPNVGKSSLFNRLLRKRDAVVSEREGTTRDIKRRILQIDTELEEVELIDTGGLDEVEDTLFQQVKEKALQTAREGDLILYMVDGRTIPDEEEVNNIRQLQRLGKSILLLVNKIDNDSLMEGVYNFYSLGVEEVFPISVVHNRGIGKVIERIKDFIPSNSNLELKIPTIGQRDYSQLEMEIPLEELVKGEEQPSQFPEIRVAIVGRVNVGKSSLLNRLVGSNRSIVSEKDGTTIDPVDETVFYKNYRIKFIDTAGLRRRSKIKDIEKYALYRTEKVLEESDVALLVVDAREGIVELDEKIGGLVEKSKTAVIIVANKWDKKGMEFQKFEREIKRRFNFLSYAPFLVVSAKTGRGIERIQKRILEVYQNYTKRIPTARLNEWIKEATTRHSLPSDIRGKEIKIYYATQFETKPPQIALIMNRPKLHFSYNRYLVRFLREKEDFTGVPIILIPRSRSQP